MLKKALSILLVTVMIAGLCACGGDDGDTIMMPITEDPMCLDPQVAETDEAKLIIANCYEGLVRIDSDGSIVPGVAESWKISSDGKTYTFNLRKDTHWKLLNSFEDVLPEGYKDNYRTQVTANDFRFALQRALNPVTQSNDAEKLFCIKNALAVNSGKLLPSSLGVEATDDQTLVISLERANPDFLRILTLPVCMPCHEDFFNATHAKYGLELKYTFCNGPFYLSRWAEDNTISLYKNDEYKGNSKVNPTEVYFYVNSENESVVKKLRQRNYDCAFVDKTMLDELSDSGSISSVSTKNIVSGLCFNCNDSVLANEDMRRALVMLTKKDEINGSSVNSFSSGIIPESVCYGDSSYRAVAGEISGISYNEQQGVALWKKGLKKLDISTAEVTVTCSEEDSPLMQKLIQNWQRVLSTSILAKVEVQNDDQISSSIYNTSFQILYHQIKSDSSSVTDMLKKFMSDSSSNIFAFVDKEYDKTVNNILKTYSGNEIINGCKKAEQLIMNHAVFMPLFTEESYAVINKGVEKIYFSPSFDSVCFINGGHS